MVVAPEGLWVPARKPDAQRVLCVTGAGKHSGQYVEIVSDLPMLRKLDESGWSNSLAIFTEKRWRITSDPTGSKCWLRSQKLASFQFDASAWEKREGKGWVPQPDVSCRWGLASELETKLRTLARKALKGKLRLTLFRCTAPDCPKGCGNVLAKDWGLPSLADLLGHLTYYHRGSSQYHEKVNEAWNQQLADELEQQEEDGEELLSMFKASLNKHNYELKTKTLNVAHHVNNIRKIVQKRGCEVSRSLANDQEVYDEVWQWQEEKSGHGRLTVSLRWLKKFTEVSALEAYDVDMS
ncbi:unnamed protein product [Symbiodinium natans]|uniref:Uncharacterized protein n=1 Tax=Symbiodinium natans TaxID=878477 RepID=A0A812ICW7_9DINO|nr:unnamed protein product [Symbiodinium natans]